MKSQIWSLLFILFFQPLAFANMNLQDNRENTVDYCGVWQTSDKSYEARLDESYSIRGPGFRHVDGASDIDPGLINLSMMDVIREVLARIERLDSVKAGLLRDNLTSLWNSRRELSDVEFKIELDSRRNVPKDVKYLRACKLHNQKNLLVIKDIFDKLKGVEQAFLLLQATLFKTHLEYGISENSRGVEMAPSFYAYAMTRPYFTSELKQGSYLDFIRFYHSTIPASASGYEKYYEFQVGKFFVMLTRFASPEIGGIFELYENGRLKKFIPSRKLELRLPNGHLLTLGENMKTPSAISLFDDGNLKRIEGCPVEHRSGYYDGIWKEDYVTNCLYKNLNYENRPFKAIEFNSNGTVLFIEPVGNQKFYARDGVIFESSQYSAHRIYFANQLVFRVCTSVLQQESDCIEF